jgi:hypothetical protein
MVWKNVMGTTIIVIKEETTRRPVKSCRYHMCTENRRIKRITMESLARIETAASKGILR